MSISTLRGDAGETSLPGGPRFSKSDLRVDKRFNGRQHVNLRA